MPLRCVRTCVKPQSTYSVLDEAYYLLCPQYVCAVEHVKLLICAMN